MFNKSYNVASNLNKCSAALVPARILFYYVFSNEINAALFPE